MGEVERLKERLREACNGHPYAKIPWPHRLLHDADDTITALLSQLEEMRERLRQLETAARNVAYATSFFQSQQAEARLRALLSQTDEGERMEDTTE